LNHDRLYHCDVVVGVSLKKKQRYSLDELEIPMLDVDVANDFVDNYTTIDSCDNLESSLYHQSNTEHDKLLSQCLTYGAPTFDNFGNSNSKRYFEREHFHGARAASLVSLSSFHDAEGGHNISKEEIELHLNITRLICSLTRGQMDDLGTILGQLNTVISSKMHDKDVNALWSTKLPTSPKDIRSLYNSGKHAIIPNSPRPSVSALPHHAHVSLKECVADLLGHGIDFDSIDDSIMPTVVSSISDSRQAKKIFNNGSDDVRKLVLYVNEWSDAFESSKCSKSNRGSCWIKTITVAPPTLNSNGTRYTYPIAIGSDGISHDEVEAKFASELHEFRMGKDVTLSWRYLKKHHCVP
jgi:hypothetical protein